MEACKLVAQAGFLYSLHGLWFGDHHKSPDCQKRYDTSSLDPRLMPLLTNDPFREYERHGYLFDSEEAYFSAVNSEFLQRLQGVSYISYLVVANHGNGYVAQQIGLSKERVAHGPSGFEAKDYNLPTDFTAAQDEPEEEPISLQALSMAPLLNDFREKMQAEYAAVAKTKLPWTPTSHEGDSYGGLAYIDSDEGFPVTAAQMQKRTDLAHAAVATGKTFLIQHVALALQKQGRRACYLAPPNALANECQTDMEKKVPRSVSVGGVYGVAFEYGGLANGQSVKKLQGKFDAFLVDEAGRGSAAQLLAALYRQPSVSKIVLVGDPEQLPPYVKSSLWMETQPWQGALGLVTATGASTAMLTTNYRCPSARVAPIGKRQYGCTLHSGPMVNPGFGLKARLLDEPARSSGTSWINRSEAKWAAERCKFSLGNGFTPAVACLFEAQRQLIKQELKKAATPGWIGSLLRSLENVAVLTVDSAQGVTREAAKQHPVELDLLCLAVRKMRRRASIISAADAGGLRAVIEAISSGCDAMNAPAMRTLGWRGCASQCVFDRLVVSRKQNFTPELWDMDVIVSTEGRDHDARWKSLRSIFSRPAVTGRLVRQQFQEPLEFFDVSTDEAFVRYAESLRYRAFCGSLTDVYAALEQGEHFGVALEVTVQCLHAVKRARITDAARDMLGELCQRINPERSSSGLIKRSDLIARACETYHRADVLFALSCLSRDRAVMVEMVDGEEYIRAAHGHRFAVDYAAFLPPWTPSAAGESRFLFHGTWTDTLDSIEAQGLRSMAKSAIYLQTGPGEQVPGKGRSRYSAHVIVDCHLAHRKGARFYELPNRALVMALPESLYSVPPDMIIACDVRPDGLHVWRKGPGRDLETFYTLRDHGRVSAAGRAPFIGTYRLPQDEADVFANAWKGNSWPQLRRNFDADRTQRVACFWTKKSLTGDQMEAEFDTFKAVVEASGERFLSRRVTTSGPTVGTIAGDVHQGLFTAKHSERISDAGNKLHIVDVYTKWCGPCNAMVPTFKNLQVNVDAFEDRCTISQVERNMLDEYRERFPDTSKPRFLFYKEGQEVNFVEGVKAPEILEIIEKNLPPLEVDD
ncbi:unnamed protein product [Prorocentrum cordatum]|uniref:Thioredoxin domain-containing protein n=1 Tax=Prorocentrum cordatum TaxID=2364126 RepID=A0ABN9TM15_9DINO|nr:unnamed protein product [Polarella glacialis]